MTAHYFTKVLKNLDKSRSPKTEKLDFITLKSYEYWIRTLRSVKSKPDVDDCLGVFPRANAKHILKNMSEHFESMNRIEDKNPKRAKAETSSKRFVRGSYFDDDDECLENIKNRSELYKRRYKAISDFNKFIRYSGASDNINEIVRKHLDDEPIFDAGAQKVFFCSLENELVSLIKQNAKNLRDPYLKRIQILQKTLNLNETELEFVIFAWIFSDKDVCSPIRSLGGRSRFSDMNSSERFSVLYPKANIEKIVTNDGILKKMNVLDDDLDISYRIRNFLDGRSGNDLDSLYCQIYKGKCVPYRELCKGNPKVELMFEMLKNNPVGSGLNVFFYGVEGTGKTELAKAIAHELKRPLVMTTVNTNGIHRDSVEHSSLGERMGSILFAAHKYKNQKAILLVDEADLILNCCEKGALNFFLEQIKVPVIWISNNIHWIEASSLRRFDYSLRFDRLDSEKRVDMWRSVIKEQKANLLLDNETVQSLADTYPITAGGITQAVSGAKRLKKSGCKINPADAVREIAAAQAELLGLSLEYASRDRESHAPSYVLDVLNIDCDMEHVKRVTKSFDEKWKKMQPADKPDSLNILFYGPPGTGKTELAKYIARDLGRKLMIRKASDLLDCYVGETEKKIRKMFREAEEKKAVLFLDEADSMIQERAGASRGWEVTQVNELLTQMENFKGLFIAATNFNDNLDQASRRRFAMKIKFEYLQPNGAEAMWRAFFPDIECPAGIRDLKLLAPGDFNAVYGTLRFYDKSELTADKILAALKHEVACKDSREGRRMGL